MAGINLANISYLHAAGDGGPRKTTQVVVIHATDNTASAEAEASYATHRPDQTSAHFYVDEVKPYRGLPLDNIAYGCLWHGNQISIQLELCGRSNQLTDATLRAAAPIVAAVCAQYGIPARKVTAAQVAAGVKGICGHADITAAFPQDGGDHTDPGGSFPWDRFIGHINGGSSMAGEYSPSTAMALAIGITEDGYVDKTGVSWDDQLAQYNLKNVIGKLDALAAAVKTLTDMVTAIKGAPAGTVNPAALATALAGDTKFLTNLAAAMVNQLPAELGRRLING